MTWTRGLAQQTASYCQAGAAGIVFYAWNDSRTGDKTQLFNTEELRRGAADGMARCQAMWGDA